MKKIPFFLFSFSFAAFLFVLFCILFILCFPFGLFCPILGCDIEAVELGTIKNDVIVNCRFEVQNKGNQPLYFLDIKPGCGSGNEIMNISFSTEPLPPGGKRECTFLFYPQFLKGKNVKKVVIQSNDPQYRNFILPVFVNVIPVPLPKSSGEPTLAPATE